MCYKFVSSKMSTWFGARHDCEEKGGTLATIDTGHMESIYRMLKVIIN